MIYTTPSHEGDWRATSSKPRPPTTYRPIQRETVALFNGLNASVALGHLPHPVCARNGQLLPAWLAWTRNLEKSGHRPSLTESLMATPARRFDQNVELLHEAVRSDPAWRGGQVDAGHSPERLDTSLVLGTAALMYWSRPHVLIESTDALEHLLVHSDIGDELPCDMLRPPMSACFIRFGDAFRKHTVTAPHHALVEQHSLQGVYVFESIQANKRALAFIPIFAVPGQGVFGASSLDMVIHDEAQPLNALIEDICANSDQGEHFRSLAQLVAKVFFYMIQPQVVQIEERPYSLAQAQLERLGVKKAAKLTRQIPRLYDRVVLGPSELSTAMPHGHGELSPHLRRGHFRLQPYGPRSSLRKVIFLAPTWVRADKLAAFAAT